MIFSEPAAEISSSMEKDTSRNQEGNSQPMDDIYKKLAKHLDDMPGGFPSTESGVELRILRRLFTPEEATLALALTLLPEEPAHVARRIHLPEEETARRLEEMAKKGLIYRIQPKDSPPRYLAWQFAVGIWEFHVNSLDRGLVEDMAEYIPRLLNIETWKKAPQLRTIPVAQSIPVEHKVMSYESAESLVRSHRNILVAPCICRREKRLAGEGCDRPEEACLIFGQGTDYYLKNGIGRLIDQEEALRILREADRAGLVLQPSNSQKISNICCCCGCCCGVLRTMKTHPEPAKIISSPFRVSVCAESCDGCGICLDRCQMEALDLDDSRVAADLSRCIGCGLCVSACPTKSLSLVRKPSSEQPDVPETMIKSYLKLARARGKLKSTRLLRMWLKSRL
jgi:NAD-dependent dihydropyrimidine dehydrogenase PreA subunit/DNA-binding Lrp family transcriptional regulator